MEKAKPVFFNAKNIAYLAVLTALVIVLQTCSGFFTFGTTSLSFVLVPIVLGSILLGVGAGAFLGAVFGLVVIFDAVGGLDPFTIVLLGDSPVFTVLLCLIKGIAAGVVPALLYKLISRKNKRAAVIAAAVSAPIANTGLFILGGLVLSDVLSANFVADGTTVIYFLIVGCAGVNFLIEFAINLVLSPALYTVTRVVEKQILVHSKKRAADKAQ